MLTAAQMRAIEAAAIESGTVTGLELMERAGAGVVEAVLGEWPFLNTPAHLHGRSLLAKFARFRAKSRESFREQVCYVGPAKTVVKHAASFVDAVLGGGHLRLTWHVVFNADVLLGLHGGGCARSNGLDLIAEGIVEVKFAAGVAKTGRLSRDADH